MSLSSQDVEATQIRYTFAKDNVGSTTCHIGGNGHIFFLPGIGDNFRLLLMMLGVEHGMGNSCPYKHLIQDFRFLNGNASHQDRLTLVIELFNLINNGLKFFPLSLINHIGIVGSDHLLVCGNDRHIQLIDIVEFSRLSIGRSGHPGEFFIHPEKILKCNCRKGLILSCNTHTLFGLHGLVQSVTPAAARHHTACKLINNHYLTVFDNVLNIFLKQPVSLDKLLGRMQELRCSHVLVFKFLEAFSFFLVTQLLIFPNRVALRIYVREQKITKPTT